MKRIISFLLVFLIVLSCFAITACDNGGKKPADEKQNNSGKNTGDGDGETVTDEDMKVDLSDAKLDIPDDAFYDNYTFTIFAPYPYGVEKFITDAPNGTPVNDAMYDRNLAVKDRLGVDINVVDFHYYTDNQAEKIIDSVLAGDHSFDACAIHNTSACAALIVGNAVLSFDHLEYIDTSKPWWVQGFSENCSMFGEDYFGISAMCYGYYSGASCLLFNKDLAEENNFPDLYELVRKGEWTIDKMIEITKNFSRDLDSNGVFDENDQIAVFSDDHAYMNFWYGAFRQSTVEKGENEEPVYLVNSARMATIVDKLNTLFNTGRRGVIVPMHGDGRETYLRAFAEGKVLFYISGASTAANLREYDINFGILPLPKLNTDQEQYGAWVDPWCLTMCVPIDNVDPDRTSIIIETMSYYSYQLLYPAVVEKKLFGSGTRDIESLEMLTKYILPNIYFDFGYIYDGYGIGYSSLIRTLIPNNSSDIASYVAERRNVVEKHYSDVYEAALANQE